MKDKFLSNPSSYSYKFHYMNKFVNSFQNILGKHLTPFFLGGPKSHLAAFTRLKIIPLLSQFHRTAPLLWMEKFNIQQQWKGKSYKLISLPFSANRLTCMSALLTILEMLLKRIKWIQFITSFRLVYLICCTQI